ncbi:MAG: type I 3-dehydroquinate dehydratase [Methanomassiliicoccales archaeon]|nr:MAG: type I 3-dehydroquinate dehydratase [Methanomassiliicoccales archaeon]
MSLICVSLMEKTASDVFASADKCKSLGADIIEVRFDGLAAQTESNLGEMSKLKENISLPVILTIRPTWEGGKFEGDEENRISLLKKAVESGFDYVDLELKMDIENLNFLVQMARDMGVKAIVSYHDFENTPSEKDILEKIIECQNAHADIAKVACYNKTFDEAYRVLRAGLAAKKLDIPYSVMGMGPFGHITRILAPFAGCEFMYAALDHEIKVDEAQVPISILKELWSLFDSTQTR